MEEYVAFKENLTDELNPKGDLSKIKGKKLNYEREIRTFQDSNKFNINSMEVEASPIELLSQVLAAWYCVLQWGPQAIQEIFIFTVEEVHTQKSL